MMDWRKIERKARKDGWMRIETKHGFFLSPPGRPDVKILVHRDPSPGQVLKTISRMRKYGFRWP